MDLARPRTRALHLHRVLNGSEERGEGAPAVAPAHRAADDPPRAPRRRYRDGVVVFDPSDGRTYSIPPDAFEVVEFIESLIDEGTADRDALVARVLDALGPDAGGPRNSAGTAEHFLQQWIDLALRLRQR